jgi:hypothetical protein
MTSPDVLIPTSDQADSVSIHSVEKPDGTIPRALAENADLVTAKGNVISKDHTLISTVDSDASLSTNVFADPEVRDYYIKLYEDAKYESRHVFDADATWTEEEERKVIRRLDWHGKLLCRCIDTVLIVVVCLWACVMFFSLQIDRGNLQQAVSGTLLQDLHLTTNG